EDFHTLSWLEYANLMLGKFDRARQNIELAKEAADRNRSADSMRSGYLAMRARYILETGQWERISVDEASSAAGGDEHASMPGMTPAGQGGRYNGSAAWIFIAGFSAAKLGDVAAADRAAAQLRAMAAKTESAGTRYDAKPVAIMARELTAVAALARGNKEEPVRAAKEAVDIEQTLSARSG